MPVNINFTALLYPILSYLAQITFELFKREHLHVRCQPHVSLHVNGKCFHFANHLTNSEIILNPFSLFFSFKFTSMDRSTRSTILFLFWFIIIALQILPTIGEGGQHYAQNQEEKPSIAKIVTDAISIMKQSHESSWNKIKAIIKQVHLQISPPNLE